MLDKNSEKQDFLCQTNCMVIATTKTLRLFPWCHNILVHDGPETFLVHMFFPKAFVIFLRSLNFDLRRDLAWALDRRPTEAVTTNNKNVHFWNLSDIFDIISLMLLRLCSWNFFEQLVTSCHSWNFNTLFFIKGNFRQMAAQPSQLIKETSSKFLSDASRCQVLWVTSITTWPACLVA